MNEKLIDPCRFTNLQQFLLGFMSAATVTGVCVLLANSSSPYTRPIRAFLFRDHPYVALALLIGSIYVLFHMIGGLLLFALGVMLPVCRTFTSLPQEPVVAAEYL